MIAQDAQRDRLERLVSRAVRVVDHTEVLHRLGAQLVPALGD